MGYSIHQFSKDHWSLLLFCWDFALNKRGLLNLGRLSSNPQRHPWGANVSHWKMSYSTRPQEGVNIIEGHDDFDVLEDLERAGLIVNTGTGLRPVVKLTEFGIQICVELTAYKQAERPLKDFQVS